MALASPDAPAADEFLYGPEDETGMGKKIDLAALKPVVGTFYPPRSTNLADCASARALAMPRG